MREVVCADFARKLERERDEAQLQIALFEQDIALIRKIIKKGGTAQDVMKFLDRPEV